MKKHLFFLLVLFTLFLVLHKNQGFRPSKIFFPPSLVFTENQKKENEIEGKTFYYLSKGRQCFVFMSEDGLYVLKFLRFDKLQSPLWTRLFPSFYTQKKINEKNKQKSSWHFCFSNVEKLPLDLGILHSQLSDMDGSVILKDNIGRSHHISLEHTRFFLQTKVTPLKIALLQDKNPQSIIESFLHSTSKRLHQNILNKTQSCMENVGWSGEKIIEFDFGEMILQEPLLNKKEKFLFFTEPMKKWLIKNMDHLVSYFDQTRVDILPFLKD